MESVLLLGGAGFLGSHIAERLVSAGMRVTVIDGLLARTGGRAGNLPPESPSMHWIRSPISEVPDLLATLEAHTLIVDAMAWTCHRMALADPLYDLGLNAESHLHYLPLLDQRHRVIMLGSSGQYGRRSQGPITEETPMLPEDIQGIHKVAAESHLRIYSRLRGFGAVSLVFGNCFGERQPTHGEDIGLVGHFLRELLSGRTVELYGQGRARSLVYARDLAEVVFLMSRRPPGSFERHNLAGHHVLIEELLEKLIEIVGGGRYEVRPMPREIQSIDTGGAPLAEDRLARWLGMIPRSDLDTALRRTFDYFVEALR